MWSLGGWTTHGKNARVGRKPEAAACLCFGKRNSKKDCGQTVCRRMKKNSSSWHIGMFESISDSI